MAYEHYPSPQSVVAAFVELTRYLLARARLEARGKRPGRKPRVAQDFQPGSPVTR